MFSKKIFFPFLICALCVSVSLGLEIPLSGVLQRENQVSNGIVFVDMEKVFHAHPMTEKLRGELMQFADTRKGAIDKMVKEYGLYLEQLREINLRIEEAKQNEEEDVLADYNKRLELTQKTVDDIRAKVADLSGRTKNELTAMEEKNSLAVLKDIEQVLKDIARKHKADIVLDRQSVLCGSDNCEDVTDEVIKRLEGR